MHKKSISFDSHFQEFFSEKNVTFTLAESIKIKRYTPHKVKSRDSHKKLSRLEFYNFSDSTKEGERERSSRILHLLEGTTFTIKPYEYWEIKKRI